ncbi:MAG: hypothetical protein R3A12_18835 [Ignavibacteria bacterium]
MLPVSDEQPLNRCSDQSVIPRLLAGKISSVISFSRAGTETIEDVFKNSDLKLFFR